MEKQKEIKAIKKFRKIILCDYITDGSHISGSRYSLLCGNKMDKTFGFLYHIFFTSHEDLEVSKSIYDNS